MWEMLLGVAEPWTLLQSLANVVQAIIFVPPPPCPEPSGFPQDVIYYGVDMARKVVWGQPCP